MSEKLICEEKTSPEPDQNEVGMVPNGPGQHQLGNLVNMAPRYGLGLELETL
ncbi:MAG: hypothetical protein JAZ03_10335 [Candidatus Thiodiazotropha taylori]|nr:hypothetical protein [Candidatus Thiodiazotropha taylori]MCG8032560.1 hypothetical protein [Candidatus Thiodiazotropha taylori]MCW4264465.1 hypothetical protein [Candidatus Thiodiazotropha endolucinida]MCW4334324.1 hypothetical protein [Candidatus Thiodiazotropha endolucinida]